MFLLTTWRMALSTKRAFFLFLSECHLSRKERHLYFLPCQMHQKRTKKILLHKKSIFLFLSDCHLSRKECHLYFLSCKMKRTFFLFLSEGHLSRKERHLYFLPCQMHQKRKKKLFLLSTWRMALFTKRTFFGSFLNIIFLEKKVICTFCLAKCIRKGQKNCSF